MMKPKFLQVKFLTRELKTLLAPRRNVLGIVFRAKFDDDRRPVNLTAQASFVKGSSVEVDRRVINGTPVESENTSFEFYDEFFPVSGEKKLDFVLFFRDQLKMLFSYQEPYIRFTGARLDYGSEGFVNGANFTLKAEPASKSSDKLLQPFTSEEGQESLELINVLKKDVLRAIYSNRLLSSSGDVSEEAEEERATALFLVTENGNSIALLGSPCPPTWD